MAKKKKPTKTSSKKKDVVKPKKKYPDYHKPQDVVLDDGTVAKQTYTRQYVSKAVMNEPKPDIEKGPKPDDQYSKLSYPPPKKHPIFREKWAKFIDSVTSRKDFKPGHLDSLSILCDLYVEYEDLSEFLRVNGRTFKVVTRWGTNFKSHMEVAQFEKVKNQINAYTKNLDLFPKKDDSPGGQSPGDNTPNTDWT